MTRGVTSILTPQLLLYPRSRSLINPGPPAAHFLCGLWLPAPSSVDSIPHPEVPVRAGLAEHRPASVGLTGGAVRPDCKVGTHVWDPALLPPPRKPPVFTIRVPTLPNSKPPASPPSHPGVLDPDPLLPQPQSPHPEALRSFLPASPPRHLPQAPSFCSLVFPALQPWGPSAAGPSV